MADGAAVQRIAGAERPPEPGLGAPVVPHHDVPGVGQFFAESFDRVVQGVGFRCPDGDQERRLDGPLVGAGVEEPVVFGELTPRLGQLLVAVAHIPALLELIAQVAFGAVVAQEFGFPVADLQVDREVEYRPGIEVIEGVEEF